MFILTLRNTAWKSFERVMNNIPDIESLKEKFIKMLNSWDQSKKASY